ncbi:hypothetical protein [Paraburkholderia kururiensis]|uniref:hypothetical protein n=1 Tax=Paraburkholderia kururiensis TaxID=984307 RepID=UPI0005A6FBC9|nr:hypothetical protein [Paraburkholderia kururiensis]
MKFQFFNSPARMPAFISARKTVGTNPSPAQWYLVLVLAIGSTLLCEFIATCAGWESGGSLRDRLVMGAMGFLIVSSSNVLPAFAGRFRGVHRVLIFAAWLGCLLYALLGEATFFAFALQEAGDARAMALNVPGMPEHVDVAPGRSLTVIAQDEAAVIAKLGRAKAARCLVSECRWRDAREHALEAQLTALKVEADEAKRSEAQEDRAAKQEDDARVLRESRRADPIAAQIAVLFAWNPINVEMLRTYLPAMMLELLSGLLWTMVFAGELRVVSRATEATGDRPAKAAPVVEADVLQADDSPTDAGMASTARRATLVDEDLAAAVRAAARVWESGRAIAIRVGRYYAARLIGDGK